MLRKNYTFAATKVKSMAEYKKRIADEMLQGKLEGMGAVLIDGPKWCGKTTTAEQHAGSVLYMNDPKRRHMNVQ